MRILLLWILWAALNHPETRHSNSRGSGRTITEDRQGRMSHGLVRHAEAPSNPNNLLDQNWTNCFQEKPRVLAILAAVIALIRRNH
jgi:hypothetical protein